MATKLPEGYSRIDVVMRTDHLRWLQAHVKDNPSRGKTVNGLVCYFLKNGMRLWEENRKALLNDPVPSIPEPYFAYGTGEVHQPILYWPDGSPVQPGQIEDPSASLPKSERPKNKPVPGALV